MASGTHFFMNPGPTNIPDRVLRAMIVRNEVPPAFVEWVER